MIDLKSQKEAAVKAAKDIAGSTSEFAGKAKDASVSTAKSVADSASEYLEKVVEYSKPATETASETAKSVFEKAQTLTGKSIEKVSEVKVGERKVGEIVEATVDSVEEKIDVDQIQDQVAKMRHQMEQVVSSWKDNFRPSTTVTEKPAETAPAKKPAAKTTPKASTATKK